MAEEGKKISFGFSKSLKKPVLKNITAQEKKKVDFIECLDEKSIKVVGGEEQKDGPLVIPMLGSRTWHDRIINKVDADIFDRKVKNEENGETANEKQVKSSGVSNGEVGNNEVSKSILEINKEPQDESSGTLEEQAAQEILLDIRKEIKTEPENLTLPINESGNLNGQREPTLEDYEQIPIESYGLAMLRGMGWRPGKGLGKNEQCVVPKIPELRSRGMGLGADKAVLKAKNPHNKTKEQEQLKLVSGALVKIIGGKHNHNYGVLEGLDEGAGRLIVKLTIGGETLSVNECLVEPVTTDEFSKNSKVLNASKYAEYESNAERTTSELKSISSDSRKRRSDSSDDDRRSRRRISSTSSSNDSHERKLKKKYKKRDYSSSPDDYRRKAKKHSSRKSKKKEKTRDRSRDRNSGYSESLDRRKTKKRHKRSRS